MKRKVLVVILLTVFCFSSILPYFNFTRAVNSSSINPPPGWVFSEQNQKIPVTLNSVTYYAYELKKTSSNTPGGWLITNSNGEIVYDNDTYQKLALTATVYKIANDPSTVNMIESEINLLKSIMWRIDLYESVTAITKIIVNISTALAGKLFGYGGAEELLATTLAPLKSREGNKTQDALFSLFSKGFVADASSEVSKYLETLGKVSTSDNAVWSKIFGVLNVLLRREAASFARGGYDAYQEAYDVLKKDRTSWSYEDATAFLNKYKEGKTRGLPFAKWYLTLIPHSENNLQNIGTVLWDNIGEEVVRSFGVKEIDFAATVFDVDLLYNEFLDKIFQNSIISNDLSNDIKSGSSIFTIYEMYYNVSIKGSLADQILLALQTQKGQEEASIKDKTIYKIGDRVQATDYINVREDASLKGKVKSVIKKGEIGTIESNYKIADGYRWWTVKWDSGPEGWCAGEYLKIYTSTAKDYYFPSVTTTININSDGSFDVVEKRTYEFSGDFHWATYALAKEGYTKLENFSIGDDNGNYKMTTSETGDPGTYTFSENSSSYTAKFFYSANNEEKTFTISYRILGGIKAYQDVADFYWKLVGTGWDKKTGYFEAYIYLPSKVNENSLYVFGHGPSNGTIQKIDGNGVYYKVSNLAANTYVEARVVFPSNILSTTKIPESKLDSILKYENGSSEEGNQGKWVLVLGESLPVLSGISPAGHSIIGGECEKSSICWDTLSLVHSGDLLEYISTDTETYSSNLYLAFPGCTKAFKVKDKKGNIGWIIGEWDGIVLAQVVDSKITQNFKPVSFSKVSGKWSGHWTGTFFEEGELSFIFQQDDMLTFKGTGILTLSGSDMTKNVIVKGSIFNNSFSFLEVQPDGSYKYCSGTISSDGKTIEGWKYSYDTLAIPLGEFKLTLQGN
jgi:hypothetical protein